MATSSFENLGLLNSSIGQSWIWKQSSRMKMDLNFSPTDSFETLPFPEAISNESASDLEELGAAYFNLRNRIMAEEEIGMTKLYNRFHNVTESAPQIVELRELHIRIDECVMESYGWTDLLLNHGHHEVPYLPERDRIRYTISEKTRLEILRRLSILNRERYTAQKF